MYTVLPETVYIGATIPTILLREQLDDQAETL
jgi:hypothetical protein